MEERMARWALTLAIVGLIGCGSGGGAAPGDDAGAAGTTEIGGSGEAGQAGGGAQAGATGEAGQTGGGTTGAAGGATGTTGGATGTTGGTTGAVGGSVGTAGTVATSTSKPAGGATGGQKTTASSTGSAGGDVAKQYVDAINAVRAEVSKPDNYTGTWAPLPNVVWSDTVAASAQAWANNLATTQNCNLQHEDQSSYGENLAMGTNLTPKQAVTMWASEKSLYTWSPTYSMTDFNAGSGHYTQLVWRKSTQVGCGSATCTRSVVISCRFSPPGNYMGQAAY